MRACASEIGKNQKGNGSRKIMARSSVVVRRLKLPCYLFQRATATSTRESADSTWSCTSCRAVSAEAFVCSAGILRQEGTVITAAKVTTGTRRDRSRIARPANVSAPAARQLHVNPTKTPRRLGETRRDATRRGAITRPARVE